MARRGDNIPTVEDYAHHGEEAQAIWWLENRDDIEHADEELDGFDDFDNGEDDSEEDD